MSQVEEHSQQPKTSQERRAIENLRLYSYMEDNFTRIFSLLAPIMSFSIQNETHIRQIMFSLQHPDANQVNQEFDNREFVQNMMKSNDKDAGSSNGQTSEESTAKIRQNDIQMTDNVENNQDEPKAGTSSDDIKDHPSPSTSNEHQSPQSDEIVKPRRKRKLNDENPVVIHCTDCNQVFRKGDGNYTRHLKEMKCSPHGCAECGKRFKKKSYLNIHMAIHTRTSEEPSPKKSRVKDDEEELPTPVDLSIKKENQSNNSEFFSFLNLYENNRPEDN
ncbi:zinc finger protein 449-like [Chironomus tepperi]|uniref:zinc finger protein 449-like n=1 Tax=Chironomus tepperi TaxID=113505 RepID=UPI00391EFEFF